MTQEIITEQEEHDNQPNFFMTAIKNPVRKKMSRRREMNKEIIDKSKELNKVKNQFKMEMEKSFYLSNHDLLLSKKFNSKIYNQKINEYFVKGLKSENFNGILKNIRKTIQEKSKKEISVIEKKNSSLIVALNKILYEKNKSEILLEKLKKQYNELDVEIFDDTDKNITSLEEVEKKILNTEKGIEKREKIQKRFTTIIEICEKNRTLNEEWINVKK